MYSSSILLLQLLDSIRRDIYSFVRWMLLTRVAQKHWSYIESMSITQ